MYKWICVHITFICCPFSIDSLQSPYSEWKSNRTSHIHWTIRMNILSEFRFVDLCTLFCMGCQATVHQQNDEIQHINNIYNVYSSCDCHISYVLRSQHILCKVYTVCWCHTVLVALVVSCELRVAMLIIFQRIGYTYKCFNTKIAQNISTSNCSLAQRIELLLLMALEFVCATLSVRINF